MYTPSAPKFELNAGTASCILHSLENPIDPMEYSYDFDDIQPPSVLCTDPVAHEDWLNKMCPPLLERQNALSREEWHILLSS